MTVQNAFFLWDWPTAAGLIAVGLIVGAALLPMAWPRRTAVHDAYPVVVAGILSVFIGMTFFVFLIAFRLMTAVPNAERVITTMLQWLIFCGGMTAGLRVRHS